MSKLTCEISGKKVKLMDGYITCNPSLEPVTWHFAAEDPIQTDTQEEFDKLTTLQKQQQWWIYNIDCKRFFATPEATISWIAHLSEKTWFKDSNFFEFMHRLRKDGNLYSASV